MCQLELERIINRALEKDRNLRYQSAADMRSELQRLKRDTDSSRQLSGSHCNNRCKCEFTFVSRIGKRYPDGQQREASSDTQVVVGLVARHKTAFLAIAGMIILIVAGLSYGVFRWLSPGSGSTIDSLAVLPFANGGGGANTDYLSDGITESLIGNLAHVPRLKVKSRNSVFHYKGKDVDVQKVGNELGVSAVVNGRVMSRGDNVEVSAELTDVRDNTEIWGRPAAAGAQTSSRCKQQIAGDIAEKLLGSKQF